MYLGGGMFSKKRFYKNMREGYGEPLPEWENCFFLLLVAVVVVVIMVSSQ
jgi:hypothetical protein